MGAYSHVRPTCCCQLLSSALFSLILIVENGRTYRGLLGSVRGRVIELGGRSGIGWLTIGGVAKWLAAVRNLTVETLVADPASPRHPTGGCLSILTRSALDIGSDSDRRPSVTNPEHRRDMSADRGLYIYRMIHSPCPDVPNTSLCCLDRRAVALTYKSLVQLLFSHRDHMFSANLSVSLCFTLASGTCSLPITFLPPFVSFAQPYQRSTGLSRGKRARCTSHWTGLPHLVISETRDSSEAVFDIGDASKSTRPFLVPSSTLRLPSTLRP